MKVIRGVVRAARAALGFLPLVFALGGFFSLALLKKSFLEDFVLGFLSKSKCLFV